MLRLVRAVQVKVFGFYHPHPQQFHWTKSIGQKYALRDGRLPRVRLVSACREPKSGVTDGERKYSRVAFRTPRAGGLGSHCNRSIVERAHPLAAMADDAVAQADGTSWPHAAPGKVLIACVQCRQRRIRCDGVHPCTACSQRGKTCEYPTEGPKKRGPKSAKEKLAEAEQLLRGGTPAAAGAVSPSAAGSARGSPRGQAASVTAEPLLPRAAGDAPVARVRRLSAAAAAALASEANARAAAAERRMRNQVHADDEDGGSRLADVEEECDPGSRSLKGGGAADGEHLPPRAASSKGGARRPGLRAAAALHPSLQLLVSEADEPAVAAVASGAAASRSQPQQQLSDEAFHALVQAAASQQQSVGAACALVVGDGQSGGGVVQSSSQPPEPAPRQLPRHSHPRASSSLSWLPLIDARDWRAIDLFFINVNSSLGEGIVDDGRGP